MIIGVGIDILKISRIKLEMAKEFYPKKKPKFLMLLNLNQENKNTLRVDFRLKRLSLKQLVKQDIK